MILSDKEIPHLGKSIFIAPFDESRLNPHSYYLRLHNELLVYSGDVLDNHCIQPSHFYREFNRQK